MGEPNKHHFLPVFYLKQWAINEGRLVEFSRPYKNIVKPRRTHPDGTGYILRLYSKEGLPERLSQAFEREFLSPIDSKAAEALSDIIGGKELPYSRRLAWAGFVATMFARMPSDIQTIKESTRELYQALIPNFENVFNIMALDGNDSSFEDISEHLLATASVQAIEQIKNIMIHDKIISGLMKMDWATLNFDNSDFDLLTSDRPVIYSDVLGHAESNLVIPIGPRCLFVAVNDRKLVDKAKAVDQSKLVRTANAAIAGAAHQFVYGSSDLQLKFIQNRMGKARLPSLTDRLRELQRSQIPLVSAAMKATLEDVDFRKQLKESGKIAR